MATGFMDMLMSATGTRPYMDPQYAADLENYQNIQALKNKTLFDTMVEQRQEKRIREAMGQPGQYQLPPSQEGPQIMGSGLFGSPEEQIMAQALMANINPSAFTPTYTAAMGLPGEIKRAQTGKIGSTVSAREGEGIGTQNVTYAITGFDEAGAPIYGELGRGSQFSPYGGRGSGGAAPLETPKLDALRAKGYALPRTTRTKEQMAAMERMLEQFEDLNQRPMTVDEAKNMDFSGEKNLATGRTAGSRLVIDAAQKIPVAKEALESYGNTVKELGFSGPKAKVATQRLFASGINDPAYADLMASRVVAITELADALKRTGITDAYQKLEEKAFDPNLSDEAFQRYMKVMLRALETRSEQFQKFYGYEFPEFGIENPELGYVTDKPERIINFEDLP